MSNKTNINDLIKQITNGLTNIMETSYPHCKNQNIDVSSSCAKINNTAFELKRITVLLQNELNQNTTKQV